mgnify:FL=1
MIKLHFKSAKFAFICILRVQNYQQINHDMENLTRVYKRDGYS